MLATIDSRQYAEILAMADIEPFGDARGDLQAGIIAAASYGAAGAKKRYGGGDFTASDFMLDFSPPPPPPTQEELIARTHAVFSSLAAKMAPSNG